MASRAVRVNEAASLGKELGIVKKSYVELRGKLARRTYRHCTANDDAHEVAPFSRHKRQERLNAILGQTHEDQVAFERFDERMRAPFFHRIIDAHFFDVLLPDAHGSRAYSAVTDDADSHFVGWHEYLVDCHAYGSFAKSGFDLLFVYFDRMAEVSFAVTPAASSAVVETAGLDFLLEKLAHAFAWTVSWQRRLSATAHHAVRQTVFAIVENVFHW
jgi:hypothetical protein